MEPLGVAVIECRLLTITTAVGITNNYHIFTSTLHVVFIMDRYIHMVNEDLLHPTSLLG